MCFSVDASSEFPQRLGRLVNHGNTKSDRNSVMKVLSHNGKPLLCLFATRHINVNDEILYDYGIPVPWLHVSICDSIH